MEKVLKFIEQNKLFSISDKLLLASSGGVDSMVLTHFLKSNQYNFSVAHCNFKLRNNESDADALFLKNFCTDNKISFFSTEFDTQLFAEKNKVSIQEAARVLRYNWLEKVRLENEFKYILTAHHLDDNIETLIFNLTKGTGIKGLRGILPVNGNLMRPLLEVSKAEITEYAKLHNLPFREDSSNATLKYDRNKIRKQVVPVLSEINQNLNKTFAQHFQTFRDIELMHQTVLDFYRNKLYEIRNESILVPIKKLLQLKGGKSLAFELFSEFGFNNHQISDIIEATKHTEAKQILSSTHSIIKDKKYFVISPLNSVSRDIYVIENNIEKLKTDNGHNYYFHFKPVEKQSSITEKPSYAFIDCDKLKFPLTLRKWKQGDYFYPLTSEQQKKKKVAKFFKDEKISHFDKENTLVLISENKIVWVCGFRIDNRFKITPATRNVLKIKLS